MILTTFNYKISDILGNAETFTLHRATSNLEKGNENTVDDIALSEEDEPTLKKYLRIVASEVADIISGYTQELIDEDGVTELLPYEFDVTYDSVEHSIVLRVNMPDTFNTAIIKPMDEAIIDAFENYVIYRVNKLKGIEFESYKQDYENSLGKIRAYINRRILGQKRNYLLI